MQGDFSLRERTPSQVLQTIALHRNLLELGGCELEVGEHIITLHRTSPSSSDQGRLEAQSDLELLAEDLDLVQRHSRTYFPIPTTISTTDRIDIRIARLLFEGHCVNSLQPPSVRRAKISTFVD